MVYVIHYDNGAAVNVVSDAPLTLLQQQGIVGGYIERLDACQVGGKEGTVLTFDEDGLSRHLNPNPKYPHLRGTVIEGRYDTVLNEDGDQEPVYVGL